MNVGKETQPSHVDADDGNVLFAHTACRLEEGAVAAHRHNEVGIEVIARKNIVDAQCRTPGIDKEVVELAVDVYLGTVFLQRAADVVDECRLLGLLNIAEKGESECPYSHKFIVVVKKGWWQCENKSRFILHYEHFALPLPHNFAAKVVQNGKMTKHLPPFFD